MTGLVDNWPHILQPHRKKFTLAMTVFMFILGLPMITRNGIYVFQLMDFYAASGMSLLWCVFFQTIAICWVFGAKRFYGCIEEMIGYKVSYYWFICWVLLAPAFMLVRSRNLIFTISYLIIVLVHLRVLLCQVHSHHHGRLSVSGLGRGAGLPHLPLLHDLGPSILRLLPRHRPRHHQVHVDQIIL